MADAIGSNLSFLAGVPRSIRCPGCKRLVDITRDGFLGKHDLRSRRVTCDRSGMSAEIARQAQ